MCIENETMSFYVNEFVPKECQSQQTPSVSSELRDILYVSPNYVPSDERAGQYDLERYNPKYNHCTADFYVRNDPYHKKY